MKWVGVGGGHSSGLDAIDEVVSDVVCHAYSVDDGISGTVSPSLHGVMLD